MVSDMIVIEGAVGGIKSALGILKGLYQLKVDTDVSLRVGEVQTHLLSAQASALEAQLHQSALLEQIREQKQEISALKAWDAEKQKYELIDVTNGRGVFALRYKPSGDVSEPIHHICTNCYQQGKKHILQTETRFPGRCEVMYCTHCKADLYVKGSWLPEHSARKK